MTKRAPLNLEADCPGCLAEALLLLLAHSISANLARLGIQEIFPQGRAGT